MHLKLTHDWNSHWLPRAYLSQYYQTAEVAGDEKAILQFITAHLKGRDKPFSSGIDVGAGPTLHHEIGLVPYVTQLDVADYLPQNLAEIQKWLVGDQDAHNWDVYIHGILKLEGVSNPNAAAIDARRKLVKQRIGKLRHCDIKSTTPLGEARRYPLVTAFYVADSVASSKADWRQYMANITTLVEPGGTLLMSALRNAEFYRVGDALFPSAKVTEDDVERLLHQLDFEPRSINVHVEFISDWKDEGFDSIIMAIARKK